MVEKNVQSLLDLVTIEIDSRENRFLPSIFMAPRILRDLSPGSFDPRLVSIGPLHREDENVQPYEAKKVSCLTNLLDRIKVPKEEILKSCMEKVHTKMKQIKECYVWTKIYDDSEIAKMMVLDACFILEFIRSMSQPDKNSGDKLLSRNVIFDLVLLENQIPFFILKSIYKCTIWRMEAYNRIPLTKFIHPILEEFNLFETAIKVENIPTGTPFHILSLLHECYKPPDGVNPVSSSSESVIYSAGDLARAGVIFKSNEDPKWEMQMEVKLNRLPCGFGYWSNPTLRMPVLVVHDFTEVILRNLIAYEQSDQTGNYIISYACAMDMLVNTQEDVTKLVESKVLVNDMGSNEETANMFNNICKNVTNLDSFYGTGWKTLNEYCDTYWPKYIVRLKRIYFNSPWSIIALGAGIALFILTALQTIFTIKSAN